MQEDHKSTGTPIRAQLAALAIIMASIMSSGCTAILSPIQSIPAERVPPQFLGEPQAFKTNIDPARLGQPTPRNYLLDENDVLGIFVEGVLGEFDSAPPVVPSQNADLPPAIGFPVPVREDGTISMPLVNPIPVRGLTLQQAEQMVSRAYLGGTTPIIREGRIIVTLVRKREHRVFVIRQDNSQSQRGGAFQGQGRGGLVTDRSDQSSRGFVLQMPAYQNDLLNALSQTGGLPGLNAKSEIRILRGDRLQIAQRDQEVREFYRTNSADQFPYGVIPTVADETNTIKIETRLRPGQIPAFQPEDVILRDGDIVYIDSRETEVYYTGGLLGGGERALPRDYDLDVLAAVSLAGVNVGTQVGGITGNVGTTQVPPTELIVLRRLPGSRQIAIRVDLNEAINDPASRLLVVPGDTLILRFKPQEELANFAISTFFTFGVRELFR